MNAGTIFARVATLAAMAGSVALLTQLFGDDSRSQATSRQDAETLNSSIVATMAGGWNGDINYAPAYAALNPYADAAQENAASTFDPVDDYWGLPREPGFETVSAYCSACHTLQIVMAQRQSRDGWDYLLHWMVEKQGMAPPAPDTREEILDYLSTAFAE